MAGSSALSACAEANPTKHSNETKCATVRTARSWRFTQELLFMRKVVQHLIDKVHLPLLANYSTTNEHCQSYFAIPSEVHD